VLYKDAPKLGIKSHHRLLYHAHGLFHHALHHALWWQLEWQLELQELEQCHAQPPLEDVQEQPPQADPHED
jgi:hypothetical protein